MQQPSRRRFLTIAGSLAGSAALGGAAIYSRGSFREHTVTRSTAALGTTVTLTVRHADAALAERAIAAAFGELAFLEHRLLSVYDPASELSRLNRDGRLASPHPYVVYVLRQAAALSRDSAGAFDVTVQPLWETYASAAKQQRLPSAADIAAARALVDWRLLKIDDRELRFARPGMRATLNGIAQGFVADRLLASLRGCGIEHALIDAGEHAPLGEAARNDAWTVGIQHPRQPQAFIALADLAGRSLATSGDYATTFTADRRHHHIVDPRTGHSPADLASVSIVAPTALEADALSTATFVLGPEKALALIRQRANVDALFVLKDGGTIVTRGFPLSAGRAV